MRRRCGEVAARLHRLMRRLLQPRRPHDLRGACPRRRGGERGRGALQLAHPLGTAQQQQLHHDARRRLHVVAVSRVAVELRGLHATRPEQEAAPLEEIPPGLRCRGDAGRVRGRSHRITARCAAHGVSTRSPLTASSTSPSRSTSHGRSSSCAARGCGLLGPSEKLRAGSPSPASARQPRPASKPTITTPRRTTASACSSAHLTRSKPACVDLSTFLRRTASSCWTSACASRRSLTSTRAIPCVRPCGSVSARRCA